MSIGRRECSCFKLKDIDYAIDTISELHKVQSFKRMNNQLESALLK
jgi:hypothetical protein